MRSEVLTMIKILILILWVVTPCRLVGRYQCFRRIHYLRAQSWWCSSKHGYLTSIPHYNTEVQHQLHFCVCKKLKFDRALSPVYSSSEYKLLLKIQGILRQLRNRCGKTSNKVRSVMKWFISSTWFSPKYLAFCALSALKTCQYLQNSWQNQFHGSKRIAKSPNILATHITIIKIRTISLFEHSMHKVHEENALWASRVRRTNFTREPLDEIQYCQSA